MTGNRPLPALRKWRWPPLQIYNGFTSEQRIRGWQLIHLLFDAGLEQKQTICSITGSDRGAGCHCENYYEPWNYHPIAPGPHTILHNRFRYPDPWLRLVEAHQKSDDDWFAKLSMQPIDLASELRAEGMRNDKDVTDVFACAPMLA